MDNQKGEGFPFLHFELDSLHLPSVFSGHVQSLNVSSQKVVSRRYAVLERGTFV